MKKVVVFLGLLAFILVGADGVVGAAHGQVQMGSQMSSFMDTMLFGIHAEMNLTQNLGLRAWGAVGSEVEQGEEVGIRLLGADLLASASLGPVRPYVGVGYGMYLIHVDEYLNMGLDTLSYFVGSKVYLWKLYGSGEVRFLRLLGPDGAYHKERVYSFGLGYRF